MDESAPVPDPPDTPEPTPPGNDAATFGELLVRCEHRIKGIVKAAEIEIGAILAAGVARLEAVIASRPAGPALEVGAAAPGSLTCQLVPDGAPCPRVAAYQLEGRPAGWVFTDAPGDAFVCAEHGGVLQHYGHKIEGLH